MKHDWEVVITEYYEMDSDWVCKSCKARLSRIKYETVEDLEKRLKNSWENVSHECK